MMKKKKPARPTKRESLRSHKNLITHLKRSEAIQANIREQLRDNVADYFGLEVGDEVVYVGAPGEPVRIFSGVVREIRFHHPQTITKAKTLGAVVVHKWKRGDGPNQLLRGGNKYEIVTNRDVLRIVRRPPENERLFRRK